jgi:hypothetical protein
MRAVSPNRRTDGSHRPVENRRPGGNWSRKTDGSPSPKPGGIRRPGGSRSLRRPRRAEALCWHPGHPAGQFLHIRPVRSPALAIYCRVPPTRPWASASNCRRPAWGASHRRPGRPGWSVTQRSSAPGLVRPRQAARTGFPQVRLTFLAGPRLLARPWLGPHTTSPLTVLRQRGQTRELGRPERTFSAWLRPLPRQIARISGPPGRIFRRHPTACSHSTAGPRQMSGPRQMTFLSSHQMTGPRQMTFLSSHQTAGRRHTTCPNSLACPGYRHPAAPGCRLSLRGQGRRPGPLRRRLPALVQEHRVPRRRHYGQTPSYLAQNRGPLHLTVDRHLSPTADHRLSAGPLSPLKCRRSPARAARGLRRDGLPTHLRQTRCANSRPLTTSKADHLGDRTQQNALRATTSTVTALSGKMSGGVLLSHAVPHAVPSALKSLTSGFGMGPGVSPSPWPPKHYGDVRSLTAPAAISGTSKPDRISGTAQWTRTRSISRSQATRPISTGQLHTLPCFHLRPINLVV